MARVKATPGFTIETEGFTVLSRNLRALGKDVLKDSRKTLREAAEPIRSDAQKLADENIRNIGTHWDRMRIGVIMAGVYIAPASRRHGGSPRPNLAPLLIKKAMLPAVKEHAGEVVEAIELMVAKNAEEHGF